MATSASVKLAYAPQSAGLTSVDTSTFITLTSTEDTVQEAIAAIDKLSYKPENPVPNSSFESGTTTNASNWTEPAGVERSSTRAFVGGWSQKITATGSALVSVSDAFTVLPYTKYILRYAVYIESRTIGNVAMDMNDITGELTAQANTTIVGSWQVVTSYWDSRDYTSIQLRCLVDNTPTLVAYFDNIELYPVGAGLSAKRYVFQAVDFDDPTNTDWAVNSLAPSTADTNNSALVNRAFDDTTEEGIGFSLHIPVGATDIIFDFKSRAETTPAGAVAVVPKLYVRELPDNGAVESWSAGTNMTALAFTTNELWQYDSQTIALSTLSLVAGRYAQFELTRVGTNGSDTLVGDWDLLSLEVYFT